nr:uncharacterized protein LOC110370242 [Helicoverpa armigera]
MWSINTVIILVCLRNVFASEKAYCLHTDDECLTKSIKYRIYQKFVRGLDGVESSDPLQVDKIDVDLPNLKYVLSKATLTGLGNCDFLRLKLTREANYHINVTGKYEKTIDDEGKHHFHIKEFWLNLDNQAEATSEYKNLSVKNEKDGNYYNHHK